MDIRAFITHKEGEKDEDCQDFYALNKKNRTISVSDGMSQSIFPRQWAELIAISYTENMTMPNIEALGKLRKKWKEDAYNYLKQDKDNWRLERSLNENKSAGATLCGIYFTNNQKAKYSILGDSTLIRISHKDEIYQIEEIISSEEKDFDSYPDYFDSNPNLKGSGKGLIKNGTIDCKKDEIILLCTDPFSEFFFTKKDKKEECDKLIREILKLKNQTAYKNLVSEWRKEGMHNDDSTLIIVTELHNYKWDIKHDELNNKKQKSDKNEDPSCSSLQKIVSSIINKLIKLMGYKKSKNIKKNRKKIIQEIVEIIQPYL